MSISYEEFVEINSRPISDSSSRWMDQKVTYDNLRLIANTVSSVIDDNEQWFTRFDIGSSKSLKHHLIIFYGKPPIDNKKAENEYDKFVGQQLATLSHSGVLETRKISRAREFRIVDRTVLEAVGSSEQEAFKFLNAYIQVTLRRSNWWGPFESYLSGPQDRDSMQRLKDKFGSLMLDNTQIGSRGSRNPFTEINRIFPKVINPVCLVHGASGIKGGRVTKGMVNYQDLSYNSINFRDQTGDKLKSETRNEYRARMSQVRNYLASTPALSTVMKSVRDRHSFVTEVPEPNETSIRANHVHHIFPRSEFPALKDMRENLILLTPGQHYSKAHGGRGTSFISVVFRQICLFNKLESILNSETDNDGFYSYDNFADVLSIGLSVAKPAANYRSLHECIVRYGTQK